MRGFNRLTMLDQFSKTLQAATMFLVRAGRQEYIRPLLLVLMLFT